MILTYSGSETDSLFENISTESFNSEWEEYDDRFEYWWDYLVSPLELRNASLFDITAITNLSLKAALSLKGSSQETHQIKPEFRVHNLMTRRFGDDVKLDENRYDGSPIGLTQRYWLSLDKVRVGAVIDKDPFEPKITDLTKVWLEWKGKRSMLIIGDYHVSLGQGLGIWTKPAYFNSYDSPRQFRRNGRGITVSNDTAVNSFLRGIASNYRSGNLSFNIYGSKRGMDAVVDDSTGNILRLSDGGNHRSSGESEKYNTVTETLIGNSLEYSVSNEYFHEAKLYVGSYFSQYDPPFRPEYSERTRFSFAGKKFGAAYTGLALAIDGMVVRGSASSDLNRNIAWKAGIEYSPTEKSRPRILLDLYNYHVEYNSPRAISPLNRPNTTGKYGGAILIAGKAKSPLISDWNAHIEMSRKPWRGYLIAVPVTESKASAMVSLNLSQDTEQVIRFRRKTSVKQVAESGTLHYVEHKIRFSEYFHYGTNRNNRLQLWEELGRRDHIDGSEYLGGMVGIKVNHRLNVNSKYIDDLALSMLIAAFSIEDNLSLYLGEHDIPYRISSVRLSNNSLRY